MIETSKATIQHLVVHQVGCKATGEGVRLSDQPLDISDKEEMAEMLKCFFFKPFRTDAYFNFANAEGNLDANMVYTQVAAIFDQPEQFYDMSVNLVELLHETSNHPKIRGGEFYMAYFADCVVDGQTCDAVGIFKSESKETFLKVYLSGESIALDQQEGISLRKLDKGCVVFNIEREEGFRVCAVDNINKGSEAHFWMDDFLGVSARHDSYFFTDNYLQMCKGFVREVFNDENHVPRTEQIDLLNKSIGFFEKNPQFNHQAFTDAVMQQPDIISAFNDYKQQYSSELPEELPADFEVSTDAVKADKKHFKTVLKLDKNFHVYVHGGRYYMEKGYDEERDLNFYKLYFKQEQ